MELYKQNEREFRLLINSIDCVLNYDCDCATSVISIITNQIENFDHYELGKIMSLIDDAATNKSKMYTENKDEWINLYSLLEYQYREVAREQSIFENESDHYLVLRLNLIYCLYIDDLESKELILDIMSNLDYFDEDQLCDLYQILVEASLNSFTYKSYDVIWNDLFKNVERKLYTTKKNQFTYKNS